MADRRWLVGAQWQQSTHLCAARTTKRKDIHLLTVDSIWICDVVLGVALLSRHRSAGGPPTRCRCERWSV